MARLFLFVALLVPASAQSLVPGDYRASIPFDGRTRTYTIHVPPAARCQTLTPLVFFFHGGGGNGAQAASSYQLNPIADREGFFAVYPDGTSANPALPLYTWNSGHCCGYAYDNKVDDVGFVRALISALRATYPVDPDRIYATGMSNGAMLTHRLAAELSNVFAAVAPVAGSIGGTFNSVAYVIPQPQRAVPILMVHGKLDENVPYAGGVGAESQITNRADLSVAESVAFWTQNNRCPTTPASRRTGNVTVDTYAGCAADVALYSIDNQGHAWPGGRGPVTLTGDTPSYELSASEIAWAFFAAHPGTPSTPAPQGSVPWIAPGGITNAASFKKGSVAPGELVTLFGANLGPSAAATDQFSGGLLDTTVAGTRVLFDGIPAPIYFTSAGQVSAFVPYATQQKQCSEVQISYNGRISDAVRVAVAPAQPALFSRDFSGTRSGVIFNQNSTANAPANPALRGSIVAMYLTGDGQTIPAGIDGKPGDLSATRPALPVSVYMNGVQADLIYAGGVQGAVAGVFQVNARVPLQIPASDAVSVIVNVGPAATPFGVTLAVR
jgi:polyhydroxybutyrate depolymerase